MEKTENYGLNQWDEQDAIKRTDFNADNAKIDAALAAVAASVGDLIVTGTYTGTADSSDWTVTQTISLGFRPRFLVVRDTSYRGATYSGDIGWSTANLGFATAEYGHYIYGQYQVLKITEDGFICGGANGIFNNKSTPYVYLAIR